MEAKKRTDIIIFLSLMVIVACVIAAIFIEAGDRITSAVTISTAILGAFGIYMQFRKDKRLNQTKFMVTFSFNFFDKADLRMILHKLEDYRQGKKDCFSAKDTDAVVSYLVWCEALASLINKKIFDFYMIDDLFAYRFFLIVNNPWIQENELFKYQEYYKGIFLAYKTWAKFKIKKGMPILQEENSLVKMETLKGESNV